MDDELDCRFCHVDEFDDAQHDCQDYMECEECPYFYSDDHDECVSVITLA